MTSQPPDSPSRRQFVKTASAAGVAAAGLGMARARANAAATPEPAPHYFKPLDEPIRMGIIGTGGMGGGHLHAFIGFNNPADDSGKPRENVQLVAVADVCKPRLEGAMKAASEKQPGVEVKGYRDYRQMLQRDDIDAVLIASPEHWHAKHAIDAIRAGKDVYCEKPMTLRLGQARRLREVVLDSDRVFTVGTQHMTQAKYSEAKRLVKEGAIGQVVSSQTSYCRNSKNGEWTYYGIDPQVVPGPNLDWKAWCGELGEVDFDTKIYHRWRRYKHWSTGIVGDLLVHMMSPLYYALDLGYPSRVIGTGNHFVDMDMENHDEVSMHIEFDAPKHVMHVVGSTNNELGLETNIRGHEGTIYLGGGNCVMRPERIFSDEREELTIRCPQVHDHDEMRLNWLRCIRTRETPMGHVEIAMKVMACVDLATRSMWGGKAWHFDRDRMEAVPV